MESKINQRKYYIDILKTLGLLLIVLAHVNAPILLKEIREFDVPLLIFVSGLLCTSSFSKTSGILSYFWKRIERLVIPTWLFLVFFYICMFLAHQLPDRWTILKSFCFQRDGGIAGYTWIILIYLWCALLTPLLQKFKDCRNFWIILIIIAIVNEILMQFQILVQNRFVYYTIFSAIPYGLFMVIGIKYNTLSFKEKKRLFICSIFLFIVLTVVHLFRYDGEYLLVSSYKYPAKIYFFSYSLPIIIILIEALKKIESTIPKFRVIEFISRHSLWIYLWHIFFLAIVNYVLTIDNWIVAYSVVISLSVFFTYIQNLIINKLKRYKNLYAFKYFMC